MMFFKIWEFGFQLDNFITMNFLNITIVAY